MNIISYFDCENKEYWAKEIRKSDWTAAPLLFTFLDKETFVKNRGEGGKILLLVDGEHLLSFCIYAPRDNIIKTALTPWMGFVYTFPQYRGHHYAGELLKEVNRLAKEEGHKYVYISTRHIGLYEKYGCEYLKTIHDVDDKDHRVYVHTVK